MCRQASQLDSGRPASFLLALFELPEGRESSCRACKVAKNGPKSSWSLAGRLALFGTRPLVEMGGPFAGKEEAKKQRQRGKKAKKQRGKEAKRQRRGAQEEAEPPSECCWPTLRPIGQPPLHTLQGRMHAHPAGDHFHQLPIGLLSSRRALGALSLSLSLLLALVSLART